MTSHFLFGFANELTKVAVSARWIRRHVKRGTKEALKSPGGEQRISKFKKSMYKIEGDSLAKSRSTYNQRLLDEPPFLHQLRPKANAKFEKALHQDAAQKNTAARAAQGWDTAQRERVNFNRKLEGSVRKPRG